MSYVVRVQVDRLPSVDVDSRQKWQLGLKLSVAASIDSAAPSLGTLLPWKWRQRLGDAEGSWNPHAATSWRIWAFVAGKLSSVAPASYTSAISPTDNRPLREKMSAHAQSLQSAAPTTFAYDTNAGGRAPSVFGFVESLTQLPAPVPAQLSVWTCMTLDVPPEWQEAGQDIVFYAVPLFAADEAEYLNIIEPTEEPAPTTTAGDPATPVETPRPGSRSFSYAEPGASAEVEPSLPFRELTGGADDPNSPRLIDLARLTIWKKSNLSFERSDWLSELPRQLAAAIDIGAIALTELDEVVQVLVQQSPETTRLIREDLVAPVAPDGAQIGRLGADFLRKFLTCLQAPKLFTLFRSASAVQAPGVELLHLLAERDPRLWKKCLRSSFALMRTDFSVRPPNPKGLDALEPRVKELLRGTSPLRALTRQRLTAIANIEVDAATAAQMATDQERVLDGEEAAIHALLATLSAASSQPQRGEKLAAAEVTWDTTTQEALERESIAPVLDLASLWTEGGEPNKDENSVVKIAFTLPPGVTLSIPYAIRFLDADGAEVFAVRNDKLEFDGSSSTSVQGAASSQFEIALRGAAAGALVVACQTFNGSIDVTGMPAIPGVLDRGLLSLELTDGAASLQVVNDALTEAEVTAVREALLSDGAAAWETRLSAAYASGLLEWTLRTMEGDARDDNNGKRFSVRAREAAARLFAVAFDFAQRSALASVREEYDRLILERANASEIERKALTQLKNDFETNVPEWVRLCVALHERCTKRCAELIEELLPPKIPVLPEAITQVAAPLTFQIDQLQDFDEEYDAWARLAGAGVMLARSNEIDEKPTHWWSLNVATLHIANAGEAGRAELRDTAMHVRAGGHWTVSARVDPVPLAISESQGVRTALVRYDSRSVVAEMEGAPRLEVIEQSHMWRRPESYQFPVNSAKSPAGEHLFPRLPPLTCGRVYHIVPYLIGHGGVLPLWLRYRSSDPTTRKRYAGAHDPDELPAGSNGEIGLDYEAVQPFIRTSRYVRTVPVGAPRLGRATVLPGVPEGVQSLAGELPIRPAPITIEAGEFAYFFLDARSGHGLLNVPSATDALRIDFGMASKRSNPTVANPSGLHICLLQTDRRSVVDVIAFEDVPIGTGGLRVEIKLSDGVAVLSKLISDAAVPDYYEDEPRVEFLQQKPLVQAPRSALFIKVGCPTGSGAVDIEPPRVSMGQWDHWEIVGQRRLAATQSVLPPEAAHQSRQVHLLDGVGNLSERKALQLQLRRPSIDFESFARWINGPIGGYGSEVAADVRKSINIADTRARDRRENQDRSLIDPATEAIAIEIVRIFPTEHVELALVELGKRADRKQRVEHADSGSLLTLQVGKTFRWDPQQRSVDLQRGHIYEVRAYAVIPVDQEDYAPHGHTTFSRTSSLVRQSWRRWNRDYLGPALTVTVEVTTDEIPTIYGRNPLRVEVNRGASSEQHRALVRLDTHAIAAHAYQWRYVMQVALISQRWSWRGRPQPAPPIAEPSTDPRALLDASGWQDGGRTDIDPAFGKYMDASFMERSIDDIGVVIERDMTRAHAYGGRLRSDDPPWERGSSGSDRQNEFERRTPTLFDKSLDYRSGAHLWRFGFQIRSRYASMYPARTHLTQNSHRDPGQSTTRWQSLLVRQRDAERRPQRPGLMLVLPLTEPLAERTGVPPLLPIFNEPMHASFHAGDGVEAVVEIARHPATKEDFRRQFPKEAARLAPALVQLRRATDEPTKKLARLGAINCVRNALGTFASQWLDFAQREGLITDEEWKLAKGMQNLTFDDAWLAQSAEMQDESVKPLEQLRTKVITWLEEGRNPVEPARGAIKYWPEYGPDPVRTEQSHDGTLIACRLDGPIGYTFDERVEAGRFDHASFVASVVASESHLGADAAGASDSASIAGPSIEAWSFAKLRFRRLEAPELMESVPLTVGASEESIRARIASFGGGSISSTSPVAQFSIPHEGLVCDQTVNAGDDRSSVRLQWDTERFGKQHEHLTFSLHRTAGNDRDTLTVIAETNLGKSGSWTAKVSPDALVTARLLAVLRPYAADALEYCAVADVSLRIFVGDPAIEDVTGALATNQWLSVASLALSSNVSVATTTAPVLTISRKNPRDAMRLRPVRASEFTPGVWCQFAAAMSAFRIHRADRTPVDILAEDLVGQVTSADKPDDDSVRLVPKGAEKGHEAGWALGTYEPPSSRSQLEEVLYVVITKFVRDALDRRREQPIAIYELPAVNPNIREDSNLCNKSNRVWVLRESLHRDLIPRVPAEGRGRIIRAIRGRTRDAGGWVDPELAPKTRFDRLFSDDSMRSAGADMDMNPGDSGGVVLGISRPFLLRGSRE